MPRLGDMLVEEKLCSRAQIEEGLETQVVHGGRLGTNLVELGFVPEKELARMLGKQYGVAYASGEMHPDPAAMSVSDPSFFDDHDILPMRVEATRLTVAVMDPRRIEPLDQLGFKAGKRVVPVVIPEFRMYQLLRKHCRAYRTMRPLDNLKFSGSQAGVKMGTVTWTPESIEGSDTLVMLTSQIGFEGNYANLTKFVNLVDKSPRFMIIENMQAAAPQQQGGQALNVTLKIDTFVKGAAGPV